VKRDVLVINTHSGENPLYYEGLLGYLSGVGIAVRGGEGEEGMGESATEAARILLTGVPLDADYSLSEETTQVKVERLYGWLRRYPNPVMGICYGHQILGHIFGGQVAVMNEVKIEPECRLVISPTGETGIFAGLEELDVFIEHRDYLSVVPDGFNVLAEREGVPYIIHQPDRSMYGVQFVPELSAEGTLQILHRFVRG
jgi:GMP synthase-like glutamine amidotransferase